MKKFSSSKNINKNSNQEKEYDLITLSILKNNFSNDIVRKVLFSEVNIVKSFLGHIEYFANNFHNIESVEQEPTNLITINGHKRDSDCIWKIKFKDNTISFVWILIEFQTKSQYKMAYRILEYSVALMSNLIKKYKGTADDFLDKRNELPIILPIVLYSGDSKWKAPLNVKEMYKQNTIKNFDDYLICCKYIFLNEQEIYQQSAENDIIKLSNLCFKFLSHKNIKTIPDELDNIYDYLLKNKINNLIRPIFFIALSLINRAKAYDMENNLKNYIIQKFDSEDVKMVRSQTQALRENYLNDINQGILLGKQEGILLGEQRGEQRGILRGKQNSFSDLMMDFFHQNLTEEEKNIIANADENTLRKWFATFMKYQSIQEVLNSK